MFLDLMPCLCLCPHSDFCLSFPHGYSLQFCTSLSHKWPVAHYTEPVLFPWVSSIMQIEDVKPPGHTWILIRTKGKTLKVNCQTLMRVIMETFGVNYVTSGNFLFLSSVKWENWTWLSWLIYYDYTLEIFVWIEITQFLRTFKKVIKVIKTYHNIMPIYD